jgi:hypothetical protein
MGVRCWRKIAKNKKAWKLILKRPWSAMDSRASGGEGIYIFVSFGSETY